MINGANIIVKCLEKENVDVIFGYPGAAILPFYDAVYQSSIKHILVRQEQNAGHAASGYARVSGKTGVCVVTSGPGATNLITAIACAYMDSIPLVAITGQVRSDLIGRDVFQEIDITGACEPFTKHSYLCLDTKELPRIIKEAFYIASTGRKGPVLIDIPVDIQQNKIENYIEEAEIKISGYKPTTQGHSMQIKRAAKAIAESQHPVICAGGGVISSGCEDAVAELAEVADIPIVSTMMGLGSIESDNPKHLGMLGSFGTKCANVAIHKADLIIICGARVGDRAMASPDQIAKRATIIHIDVDPAEIGKNMAAHIPIVGDLKNILKSLLGQISPKNNSEWVAECTKLKSKAEYNADDNGYINPKLLLNLLSKSANNNSVLIADVGQNQIWSANHYNIKQGGKFLTSGGLGTMGYSIPAAIGAKLADSSRQVIAVCGDGSFQMQLMELATAIQHECNIKIIVMNNTRLGMVSEIQRRSYDNRYSATSLNGNPDFVKLAEAYGIKAERISENSKIGTAIESLLSNNKPQLLECIINPDETSL